MTSKLKIQQLHYKRRKAEAEIIKFCIENNIEIVDGTTSPRWYIYYLGPFKEYDVVKHREINTGVLYFGSYEGAMAVITGCKDTLDLLYAS